MLLRWRIELRCSFVKICKMTREEKINAFDINGLSVHDQLFGLPFSEDESEIIVVPVPWEVTVSFGSGTVDGPQFVFEASKQVDLFLPDHPELWKRGIAMIEEPRHLRALSNDLRPLVEARIHAMESKKEPSKVDLEKIEAGCREMNEWVQSTVAFYLQKGKRVVLIGGDHSTPLGYIKALSNIYPEMGVLQIDAHADLRVAYEGLTYSHASIMHNVLSETGITSLTQVGIRDFCHQEYDVMKNDERVTTFFDRDMQKVRFEGGNWQNVVEKIVESLPRQIYLSVDVDGLQPVFCPNTGTPVHGGLTPEELLYLVRKIYSKKIEIIGFDINEVGASEWDANVASRLLWHICAYLK